MLQEKELVPVTEDPDASVFNQETEPIELDKFILDTFANIDKQNAVERLIRYRKWAKNRAFYRGDQRGFWDARKKTWVSVDINTLSPSEASVLVVNNQFRPQVKTLTKEFSRSQTRIRTNAISDSQRAVQTARFSDALIKYYQPKLRPESFRQIEAKYLLLCGNVFLYTYYDPALKSTNVQVKRVGKRTLPAYEGATCPSCGYEGKADMTKCPECGDMMEKMSVPPKEIQGVLGYDTINAGDIKTEIVDPVEIEVWAGAQSLEMSPFLKRRRIVREEFLLKTFPFYKPKENGQLSDNALLQFQFLDTINDGKSGQRYDTLYEYEQLWLEPEMYFNKSLKKAVTFKKKTGNGWQNVVLKEGTILSDEFPDGMYVCKVGNDILGYYNDSKNDCWVHIPFDINIDGFWADGLEDAVMNQQIINEYTSLSVENVLYNASPKLVVNPVLINPATVTGRPKDMIVLNNNAIKDTQPKNAFAQISGMNLTAEVMNGVALAKTDMREQTGALVAFNGQGDPTLTTATAMSIARDSALALVSTPLAVRAEREEDWCWQILKFVKKYWYDQKYKFLLGKYNEIEAESFRDSVLEQEINVFVESNSWQPQTNYERLQNLGAYLTAFGIPLGFLNPMIPQPVKDYASQLYNVPFEFNELSPDIRIAQRRLDMAKEVAAIQIPKVMKIAPKLAQVNPELATKMAMTAVIAISNAMQPEEDIDEHKVFIEEYTKYLKTDEGQSANPILREAIKQTIADHKAFMETQAGDAAAQAGMLNNAAAGGQPPPQGQPAQSPTFQAPSDSPFQPQKVGQIQDYSANAKNT